MAPSPSKTALITDLKQITEDRQALHGSVECAYSVFTDPDGQRYLQLETFGSKERKIPGKPGQAIQLSESAAAELKRLIEQTFPSLR